MLGAGAGSQAAGNARRHPCDLGRGIRTSPDFAGPGEVHGETDDFSYNVVRDPVHVRDFQATILHLFGIDHERFSYRYQGLDVRLTGVERAEPVKGILA